MQRRLRDTVTVTKNSASNAGVAKAARVGRMLAEAKQTETTLLMGETGETRSSNYFQSAGGDQRNIKKKLTNSCLTTEKMRLNVKAPTTPAVVVNVCPRLDKRTPCVCSSTLEENASSINAPYAGTSDFMLGTSNPESDKKLMDSASTTATVFWGYNVVFFQNTVRHTPVLCQTYRSDRVQDGFKPK